MRQKLFENGTASVRCLLDTVEYEQAKQAVRRLGFESFSQWIRAQIKKELLLEGDATT